MPGEASALGFVSQLIKMAETTASEGNPSPPTGPKISFCNDPYSDRKTISLYSIGQML